MAPDDPQLLPWGFLEAATGIRTILMEGRHLAPLLAGPQDTVAALAGGLRVLEVQQLGATQYTTFTSIDPYPVIHSIDSGGVQAHMQDLGRLLAGCNSLQVLSVWGAYEDKLGRVPGDEEQPGWRCHLLEGALLAGLDTSSSNQFSSRCRGLGATAAASSSSSSSSSAAAAAAASPTPIPAAAASGLRGMQRHRRSPLRQLELIYLPFAPFGAWLRQRGQLGQLRRLQLTGAVQSDFDHTWGWFKDLSGLQELRLNVGSPYCPPDNVFVTLPPMLTYLSRSVTQLSVRFSCMEGAATEVVGRLTQLRRLELIQSRGGATQFTVPWLTALRLLTHLKISYMIVTHLPPSLGHALPQLAELVVWHCGLESLPAGMTALSRLMAPYNKGPRGPGVVALSEATALRHLNLSRNNLKHLSPLSTLTGLEVLHLRGRFPRPSPDPDREDSVGEEEGSIWDSDSEAGETTEEGEATEDGEATEEGEGRARHGVRVPSLPRLLNLRHLDLTDSNWRVAELAAMGGLQRLTRLDLAYGLQQQGCQSGGSDAGSLPALGPLPALLELDLTYVPVQSHQWPAVGAWLAQQSQLTRLSLKYSGRQPASHDPQRQAQGLAQLPTQLVALDLRHCGLQEVPPHLSQLTGLQALLVGKGNPILAQQLPAWLPVLQQLRVLDVQLQLRDAAAVEEAAGLLVQLQRLEELYLDFAKTDAAGVQEALIADLASQLRGQLPCLPEQHVSSWWWRTCTDTDGDLFVAFWEASWDEPDSGPPTD